MFQNHCFAKFNWWYISLICLQRYIVGMRGGQIHFNSFLKAKNLNNSPFLPYVRPSFVNKLDVAVPCLVDGAKRLYLLIHSPSGFYRPFYFLQLCIAWSKDQELKGSQAANLLQLNRRLFNSALLPC